jgi:hypothetical protein
MYPKSLSAQLILCEMGNFVFMPYNIKAGHPERSEAESNFWMEERSEFIQKQATKERRDLQ